MLAFKKMKTDNLEIIRQGTIIVLIVLVLISTLIAIYIYTDGNALLPILIGILGIGIFVYFTFFIPQAQRLEVTANGIVFYSSGQCRTYFWSQMKDVKVKKGNNLEKQLVVEMYQSGSNRTRPESYFEVPINAIIYGYKPDELKAIIKKYLSQPRAPVDAKRPAQQS